ncbi:MAG: DNA methyltransferase, partial [Polyangiales bacterium]
TTRRGTPLAPEARTALRHVGGPAKKRGDAAVAELLAHAFDVGEDDADAARAHVHGFHSYPARLHPVTAARLVGGLAPEKGVVLDPFCGSGTVLVESSLAGRRAVGTDVNPLAIRLAHLKVRGLPEEERRALLEAARWVEGHVTMRRKTAARATKKYGPEDVALFEPHVLLELDSIRAGLDRVEPKELRDDLELVLSAILTKVSRKRGDSAQQLAQRRLAPGFTARLFLSKAEELVRSLEMFERALPKGTPAATVRADDARTLGTVGAATIDLVATSPPYAATYDYVDHHDLRLRWLGMPIDRFASLELGARRDYSRLNGRGAQARWHDELGRTLQALARTLRQGGTIVLVIADSAVAGTALRAVDVVEAECGRAGLAVHAVVSQERPHFHTATRDAYRDAPREEHLIALRRP